MRAHEIIMVNKFPYRMVCIQIKFFASLIFDHVECNDKINEITSAYLLQDFNFVLRNENRKQCSKNKLVVPYWLFDIFG